MCEVEREPGGGGRGIEILGDGAGSTAADITRSTSRTGQSNISNPPSLPPSIQPSRFRAERIQRKRNKIRNEMKHARKNKRTKNDGFNIRLFVCSCNHFTHNLPREPTKATDTLLNSQGFFMYNPVSLLATYVLLYAECSKEKMAQTFQERHIKSRSSYRNTLSPKPQQCISPTKTRAKQLPAAVKQVGD